MPSLNFKLFKFIVFVLFGFCFLEFSTLADAQVPPPNTTCTPGDPEFHSLRPYQASPCQTAIVPTAKFCGNTLTLQDEIGVTYQPGIDNCSPFPGGKVRCSYVLPATEKIIIDLSNATLPIMGNTENVPNSQNPAGSPPPLTDAEKVNGYVSWYLNGVTNRAEDGSSKNSDYNTVNLSGPINKLLPQAIQESERTKTVKAGYFGVGGRHDQTVVCANGSTAVNCYPPGLISTNYKLSSWIGELSWLNSWANGITSVINFLTNLFPLIPHDIIADSVGNHWNYRLPPLPWDDGTGKPFTSEVLYQKAYSEWRGNTCILVPIVNKIFCVDNFLIPNQYANLFPYIPLSSTEDVQGSVQVDSVSVNSPGISNVSFDSASQSAILFFPHLAETDELGSALQDTYISKDQQKDQKTGAATAVEPPVSCSTVDVRTNAGDKLFATQLSGVLKYTASFTCNFTPPSCSGTCIPNRVECQNAGGTGGTGSCDGSRYCCDLPNSTPPAPQTCSKIVNIALSTSTSVPKIDDIWSRLVAGPTAVVKRLFPQLGTQIGTLKDLPGSTAITYSGANASSGQLNFPHVGGISEYFLNGIQTLLRPKGYGNPISFGKISVNPTEAIDCDQSAPNITLPNTIGKQALHDLAIHLEGGKTGDHVLECYNDVARKSLAAGISPAFTFLMWINESGGSNYNISNQDWGVNSSQIAGFNAQLAKFLQLPTIYKSTYSECFGKTRTDTETFFDLFAVGLQGGLCVPEKGQPYIDLFNRLWSVYTTCPFIGYPFSSSCELLLK